MKLSAGISGFPFATRDSDLRIGGVTLCSTLREEWAALIGYRWLAEIARNSVESKRVSTLLGYATAAPFAIGFLETAFLGL